MSSPALVDCSAFIRTGACHQLCVWRHGPLDVRPLCARCHRGRSVPGCFQGLCFMCARYAPAFVPCSYHPECAAKGSCPFQHGARDPRPVCGNCLLVRIPGASSLRCRRCARALEMAGQGKLPAHRACSTGQRACIWEDDCIYQHGPRDQRPVCGACRCHRVSSALVHCYVCKQRAHTPTQGHQKSDTSIRLCRFFPHCKMGSNCTFLHDPHFACRTLDCTKCRKLGGCYDVDFPPLSANQTS